MYLPKSKYKGNKHTAGGEFVVARGGIYRGWYYERFDGKYFTGKEPGNNDKEIQRIEDAVENYNTPSTLPFASDIIAPTESERKRGRFTRYFLQDRRNKKIVEVKKAKYDEYLPIKYVQNLTLVWLLQGPSQDIYHKNYKYEGAATKNEKTVVSADNTMKGLKEFIKDYTKFVE